MRQGACPRPGTPLAHAAAKCPLRRAIQRYIEDPLSEELIRGHLRGGEIELFMEDGGLAYRLAGQGQQPGRRLA